MYPHHRHQPSARPGPVPARPSCSLYLAHYEYGIMLKMIRSDIPLSSLITSKSLARSWVLTPAVRAGI